MVRVSHLTWRSSELDAAAGGRSLAAVADFAGQELGELNQVRAIALDRVVAEVLLELEVIEKLANQGGEVLFRGPLRRGAQQRRRTIRSWGS